MEFFEKYWRYLFGGVLGILCLLSALLLRVQAVPVGFGALATPAPVETPAPTPAAEAIMGAVTILVEQTPLCTLASQQEAEQLLGWWLEEMKTQFPEEELLLEAGFEKTPSLRAALMGEATITFSEAKALLQGAPDACPVRLVTRKVLREVVPFALEQAEEDARLPKGTQLIIALGRVGELLQITEQTYRNGVLVGQPSTSQVELAAPLPQLVAAGSYVSDDPTHEAGRKEGEAGKAAPEGFKWSAPCKGEILSNFGTRRGVMHYGLDYACKVGEDVYATADGVVKTAMVRASYGFLLEIDHGDGFVTRLSPLQEVPLAPGDAVTKGEKLGILAPPEDEEAKAHLHVELLIDGVPYNPRYYIRP